MDIERLKEYIVENDKVEIILESLGCHHIRRSGNRYTCANPDGDNLGAVNIFLPSLNVVNYTRSLDSISKYPDLFSLVQFYNETDFFNALKYVCNSIGISTYEDFDADLPESILLTRELLSMIQNGEQSENDRPLKPISERILSYYIPCVNDIFLADGISYSTQVIFELGYDPESNRITIPIRNYDSVLVGIKGRLFKQAPADNCPKYIYLEPCNKGQILFGLDKTYQSIQKKHVCYVGESEKFVMQLFSYGDTNCVSVGGKGISHQQIEFLSRMCVDIVLCFDKDVEQLELESIADKFIGDVNVYAIVDKIDLLDENESPSDCESKWKKLKEECLIKIR